MKRVCTLLLCGVLLLCAGLLRAQGRVSFEMEGRASGSAEAIELNGITYVDVQRTARKLGANVELFATSKQAKITVKGFFAILTNSLKEVIVNGEHIPLTGPVIVRGGKLMAPVEVFLIPSFQEAVNRQISFAKNTFVVERRFVLELADVQEGKQDILLVFNTQKKVIFETAQPNAHTVLITLPGTVIKRDTYRKLHNNYIASFSARQVRGDVELKVILEPKAKVWSFTEESGGKLVFRAGAIKAAPQLAQTVDQPAESAISDKQVNPKEMSAPLGLAPSILEEDEFEEMNLEASGTEVALAEEAPQDGIMAAVQTTTISAAKPSGAVIQSNPHPLAIISAHKKMRIVVDPGHGGKDPGAVRGKYREKDWNLAVSKELVRLLKKGNFEVKITRDNDTFIPLSDRSKIANTFKADLFVSVHVNSTKNSKADGFQVYFRSEKATDKEAAETAALENEATQYEEVHYNFVDALLQSLAKNEYINESSKLAGYVKNAVYKQPGIGIAVNQNNAIRQANFYVLKGVQSPAILVEMGFISSSKDRARLSQASVQKKMAQGIYNGIVNYAKQEGWLK